MFGRSNAEQIKRLKAGLEEAKRIKVVNEDAGDRLIDELKNLRDRLRRPPSRSGGLGLPRVSDHEETNELH